MKLYHTIIILSIAVLLFQPVLAQASAPETSAQGSLRLPATLNEAFNFFFSFLKLLPQAFFNAFREVFNIFLQIIDFARGLWDKYIWPQIKGLWHRILKLLGREVEKRKPIIRHEIEKEKQEITKEAQEQVQKAGQGFLERLKNLIKENL